MKKEAFPLRQVGFPPSRKRPKRLVVQLLKKIYSKTGKTARALGGQTVLPTSSFISRRSSLSRPPSAVQGDPRGRGPLGVGERAPGKPPASLFAGMAGIRGNGMSAVCDDAGFPGRISLVTFFVRDKESHPPEATVKLSGKQRQRANPLKARRIARLRAGTGVPSSVIPSDCHLPPGEGRRLQQPWRFSILWRSAAFSCIPLSGGRRPRLRRPAR